MTISNRERAVKGVWELRAKTCWSIRRRLGAGQDGHPALEAVAESEPHVHLSRGVGGRDREVDGGFPPSRSTCWTRTSMARPSLAEPNSGSPKASITHGPFHPVVCRLLSTSAAAAGRPATRQPSARPWPPSWTCGDALTSRSRALGRRRLGPRHRPPRPRADPTLGAPVHPGPRARAPRGRLRAGGVERPPHAAPAGRGAPTRYGVAGVGDLAERPRVRGASLGGLASPRPRLRPARDVVVWLSTPRSQATLPDPALRLTVAAVPAVPLASPSRPLQLCGDTLGADPEKTGPIRTRYLQGRQ